MRTGFIYKAESSSGKIYIGQTIHGLKRRKWKHYWVAFNRSSGLYHTHLSCAIRAYGRNDFTWEILYSDIPHEKLSALEIETILKYDSYTNGYNSTLGGEGVMMGKRHSVETKAKMSADRKGKPSHRKGKKLSSETKLKMSANNIGEGNPSAKLNQDHVNKIRSLYKKGSSTQKDIAKLYSVTQATISAIITNKTWKLKT